MENKIVSLHELTLETVHDLSEEEVSLLLSKLISDLPKEKRLPYIKIINTAFDFRSIHANSFSLKGDLKFLGFKFFTIPYNNKLIWGIRRRK